MHLTLEPLVPIDPPYKQILYASPSTSFAPRQVLMYQGVRHFLLKYRPAGSKLTTHVGSKPVFTYQKTNSGYTITSQAHELTLKLKGKKQVLPIGIPYTLTEAEFFASSLIYGINWWRFRSVLTPNAMPPLEEDESEDAERERIRFKVTTNLVISSLLMLFVFSFIYNYFNPPKPAPVVTKIELKAPKFIPHKQLAELPKPTPTPTPTPTPKEEPKKEIAKKEPPKPKEKPKPVVKKEVPKPPKKVAKASPPKAPEKKQVVVPPPQVAKAPPAKKEPVSQTMSTRKTNNPPATGVVAKKTDVPPAPSESAQLMKSLSFLSSGSKTAKQGNLEKYSATSKQDKFINAPTLGGSTKDSGVLSDISAKSGDTDIKTRSSRTIATDAGFGSPKGKGLNDVQGKVSLTELYNAGSGGGSAFGEGTGLALSGPGDLSEAEIEKALSKFLGKFQFCYEKALLTDSSLAGNIRMQWTINENGSASGTKVLNSQMNNSALHSCIQGVLKDIPFPRPKGGPVTAKKIFSFKSSTL